MLKFTNRELGYLIVNSAYVSTKIEGNRTTFLDSFDIIKENSNRTFNDDVVDKLAQRDFIEVKNFKNAYETYIPKIEKNNFITSLEEIKNIHALLMKGLGQIGFSWKEQKINKDKKLANFNTKYIGNTRADLAYGEEIPSNNNYRVSVGFNPDGTRKERHKPLLVNKSLNEIITDFNKLISKAASDNEKIQLIMNFHFAFETIHPFIDGNGRVGRFITDLQLIQNNLPPLTCGINPSKKNEEYYSILTTIEIEDQPFYEQNGFNLIKPLSKDLLNSINETLIKSAYLINSANKQDKYDHIYLETKK